MSLTPATGRPAGRAAALLRDRRGASAVEFALLAPVFLLVLAGIVDVSRMISARAGLDASVSAGANYVLLNGGEIGSSSVRGFAEAVAAIAIADEPSATASVSVNGGYTVSLSGGRYSEEGSAAVADKCFCPEASGGSTSWKSPMQCDAACPGGGHAGKFVEIRASTPYAPMFGYGITGSAEEIGTSAMVNP